MRRRLIAVAILLLPVSALAQTAADYARALSLRDTLPAMVVNQPGPAMWIRQSHRFVYRKSVKGGHEFVMVDADTRQKSPAFDHAVLADALKKAGMADATALKLGFSEFRFADNEQAITFTAQNARWTCALPGNAEPTRPERAQRAEGCTKRDSSAPPTGATAGVNGPVRGEHNAPDMAPRTSPDGKC
jgi:hypothetical protein